MPLQEFDYSNILEGRVFFRQVGMCDLNINLEWGDEGNITDLTIPLTGIDGVSGVNYFGGGKYFSNAEYFGVEPGIGTPVSKGFSAIGKGTSVFVQYQVDTVNPFEVDYIEVPSG